MIGVDEAGKGAVVGSMFVSAVEFDTEAGFGVPDSKRLSVEERERLAERVRNTCAVAVVEVTPDEIDSYVEEGRMNDLMVEAHGRALDELGASGHVVADASDVSAKRFARRLDERVGGYEVSAEHGADEEYDAVGAASVVAKVERDAHVARYGAGSGYPGDPATVEFLRDHAPEYPVCVRESWSTSERVAHEEKQSRFEDFDA